MGLSAAAWLRIGLLGLATCLLFRTNLVRLWNKTNPIYGEANWQHAICVPLVGLYYLYIHRDELLKARIKTSIEGLPILIAGPLVLLYGIYPGQNDYIKDLAIVITLIGLVLFTCGWQVLRLTLFPILFLICAFPWPGLVYSRVAGPLQQLAAMVAVEVMKLTGVTAAQSGTKIIIGDGLDVRILNVAEACAGMRSLMTFITVGAAMAFLAARPLWQKLIITASAVPIAIVCNVMRVSGQGLLDKYASHEWSNGFAHAFAGMVMLIPAFFLLWIVGKVLDMAVVEVAEPTVRPVAAKPRVAAQPDVLKRRRPAAKPPTGETAR